MARAIWSGSITFGLVSVPVKAFTAVRDHDIHFHQLEKKSGARIRNQKVSEKSGKPVDRGDIELGFEIRSGRHVTFEKGELDELRPESTRMVEVSDFVDLDEIDPMYYERTYWLVPAGDAAKQPYQLLLAAMDDRQRVGIGSVVMRNKQYLAAVRPLEGALAMSTMRFADEVVPRSDIDGIPSRRTKLDAKAVRLATQIIDSLASEWEPKRYHDTYTEELRRIIDRKDKGKDVVERKEPEKEAEVLDLMAALEASVSKAKRGRKAPTRRKKAAAKRKAPARKSA
jgi:DNA end-binding protein Ku